MKVLRDLSFGLLSALASSIIVLGAISFALMQSGNDYFTQAKNTNTPQDTSTNLATLSGGANTYTPKPTLRSTQTPQCNPPANWSSYTIQIGDTLDKIARSYHIKTSLLKKQNCLDSDQILTGTILYVPPLPGSPTPSSLPHPTITSWVCLRPSGWVNYVIQPKDTLLKLSRAYGISVNELQAANCILDVDYIYSGQIILVPNIPTRTVNTSTHTAPKPTSTPRSKTRTPTLFVPTNTNPPPEQTYTPTAITASPTP